MLTLILGQALKLLHSLQPTLLLGLGFGLGSGFGLLLGQEQDSDDHVRLPEEQDYG